MRILLIGGTHFVGHAMADAALHAGHDVTVLHRNPTEELPAATHLLADRDGDLSVLDAQSFDATIDVCAYVPAQVRSLHDALGDRGGHHLFVSTVSVYAEPDAPGADEDSALLPPASEDATEVTNETYGPLKVTCERVADELYTASGLTVIRPTYVVGPRDKTARYPWWPLRAARGGPMIAPGPSEAPMQYVDARDLGAWTVRLAEGRVAGTYTAAAPATTFGALLEETVGAVDSDARLVQVDGDWLVEQGVTGLQLPLWTEGAPEFSLAMGTARARAAGLTCRPFAETVRDTLAWAQANPDDSTNAQWGMEPERERELLTAWAAQS
ncbi:MAG TPA: NAD-dependent epimerase/dehydratase family protein [Nocardioides sp.]|jgi:2'-hydroxyisoflavone reductase|uniref:NAD-dependent epimerase/dehydratase family protein n=1 Tax=Nocardioides sp. TaxID=35761 RepID=UPI002E326D19|nr:NAD-dependent epimerase/dehydratase family protein [Nocardioides sp.]HEX3932039.1 NAD-dependent epimerase/dehydratase family protein [Nocardioides sp.]